MALTAQAMDDAYGYTRCTCGHYAMQHNMDFSTKCFVNGCRCKKFNSVSCPFQRLRDYPGCFEDCPDTDKCPNTAANCKAKRMGT
jgi:hypothetical protein